MKIFRGFLAFLTALLLIPIAVVGSLVVATTDTYLNPDFYQSDTFEELFYDIIVNEVSQELLTQGGLDGFLTPEDIEEEVRLVLPPDVIANIIEDALNQIYATPLPDEIIISTGAIKTNLPLALDSLFAKIQSTLPPEISTELLKQQFQHEMIDYIPPQISLSLDQLPVEARNGLVLILMGTHHFLESFLVSIGLHLIFIGLLIWKPVQKILKWIGGSLLASGVFIFAFIRIITSGAQQLGEPLVLLISQPILGAMTPWGLGLVIAGIASLALGFILPHTILNQIKRNE